MKILKLLILSILIAPAIATQLGGGCASTPTDSSGDNRDTNSDYDSNRYAIPGDARIVDEGTGRIAFTPRGDGRVYLYDADDRTLIDDRNIRRGQQYVALIDNNKAQLDGRTVCERDMKRKHVHRIYFLSDDYQNRDWNHDHDQNSSDKYHLPKRAEIVADSKGELNYRARNGGRFWVIDGDDERMVFTQSVRKNDQLIVTPDKDRVTINGKTVFNGNLVRDHLHRIYFAKE